MKDIKEISTEELTALWEDWYNEDTNDGDGFYIKGHWFEDVFWELLDRGVDVTI